MLLSRPRPGPREAVRIVAGLKHREKEMIRDMFSPTHTEPVLDDQEATLTSGERALDVNPC